MHICFCTVYYENESLDLRRDKTAADPPLLCSFREVKALLNDPPSRASCDTPVTPLCHAFAATEVKALLHDPCASEITQQSDDFWIVIAALKAFVVSQKDLI